MNKSYAYAKAVVNGEIVAPSQVKQACINFIHEYDVLQHQDDYEYMWNHQIEKKIDSIIQNLNFARGAKSAQPMYPNLALFQWFLIQNTFCWVYKEFPTKRKIREVIFTVARKNAKSVIACIVHIIGFFLDEANATHYIGSNTKKQAGIIFDELSSILKASPNIKPYFNIKKGYIEFLPDTKNCKIEPLSGDSQKADGTMTYIASVDELGASNDIAKMVSSLHTGMFGPRNPLMIKISTSYPISNGYNYWQETVNKLIENTNDGNSNPRMFGLAYLIDNPFEEITLDGNKAQRWEDKSIWLEANPLFAEVESLRTKLHEDYETSKQIPKDLHLFKTKNLNIWQSENIDDGSFFVDLNTIEKYEKKEIEDWNWWRGKKQVMIGIDLAPSRDNSAITFAWHDVKNKKTYFKNKVYYAKNMESGKIKSEKIPYDQWSKKGWCEPLGEETVDFVGIAKDIQKIITDYNISLATILYDVSYSYDLVKYINENIEMEVNATVVHQNARVLNSVIDTLQRDIYNGNVYYAPNKLLVSAFINGEIEFRQGKTYIKKNSKVKNKVDSLFATFNAYKGIMFYLQFNRFESNMEFEVW
ncbi:terminase large subunit domain-containing protein [Bacillus cereus]|uniref:terminase large subunit domain-containing protein n=1 Tax=Bacillus cereus TaxID=1396 RepID=UPI000BFBACAE|nr:terminase large subunit [Bacillus cereus]PGK45744.1 terminase [Bacillus cereus]